MCVADAKLKEPVARTASGPYTSAQNFGRSRLEFNMKSSIEFWDLCGVVYFPEMDQDAVREIGKLKTRVKSLEEGEGTTGATEQSQPTPKSSPDNWVKRNAYWFWPTISVIFGSGAVSAVVSVILSFVVDHRIDLKLTEPLQRIGEHTQSIVVLETKQSGNSDLLKLVLQREMERAIALSVPDFNKELPQLNRTLVAATLGATPTSASVIRDLHKKLTEVLRHNNNADAWQATVSLASYHSAFNQNPFLGFAAKPIKIPHPETAFYNHGAPPIGETEPVMSAPGSSATKETGAWYAPVGLDLNQDSPSVNPFIRLDGGGVVLDGHQIRNVIFVGVHIVYNGGPLILDTAIFINCHFSIQQSRASEDFIARSLESDRVTFKTRG